MKQEHLNVIETYLSDTFRSVGHPCRYVSCQYDLYTRQYTIEVVFEGIPDLFVQWFVRASLITWQEKPKPSIGEMMLTVAKLADSPRRSGIHSENENESPELVSTEALDQAIRHIVYGITALK